MAAKPMYLRADLAGHVFSPQLMERTTRIPPPEGEYFLSDGLRGLGDINFSSPDYQAGVAIGAAVGLLIGWKWLGKR